MSLNISLYTVNGVLILDNTGKRVYAKYFKPPHDSEYSKQPYPGLKQQLAFEKALFKKIYKQRADVALFDNQIVTYKETSDVLIITFGNLDENEALLFNLTSNIIESFEILLKNQLDKKTINENFDLVVLAIDEAVDDGIILEIDPAVIASRVTTAPKEQKIVEFNDGGLINFGFNYAKNKLAERLNQAL